MANRAHFYRLIQDAVGNVLPTAEVTVCMPGTVIPIQDTLYTHDDGSGAVTNPYTIGEGVIDFYLEKPQRVRLAVRIPNQEVQYYDDVDVVADQSLSSIGPFDYVALTSPSGLVFYLQVTDSGDLNVVGPQ